MRLSLTHKLPTGTHLYVWEEINTIWAYCIKKSCLTKPSCETEDSGGTAQFSCRKNKACRDSCCYLRLRKNVPPLYFQWAFPSFSQYIALVITPAEVPIQTSFVTYFNWGFNVRMEKKTLSSTAFHGRIMCSTNSKPSAWIRIHFFQKPFLRIQ